MEADTPDIFNASLKSEVEAPEIPWGWCASPPPPPSPPPMLEGTCTRRGCRERWCTAEVPVKVSTKEIGVQTLGEYRIENESTIGNPVEITVSANVGKCIGDTIGSNIKDTIGTTTNDSISGIVGIAMDATNLKGTWEVIEQLSGETEEEPGPDIGGQESDIGEDVGEVQGRQRYKPDKMQDWASSQVIRRSLWTSFHRAGMPWKDLPEKVRQEMIDEMVEDFMYQETAQRAEEAIGRAVDKEIEDAKVPDEEEVEFHDCDEFHDCVDPLVAYIGEMARMGECIELNAFDDAMEVDEGQRGTHNIKKLKLTVDSGAGDSVIDGDQWPNQPKRESEGSRKGRRYVGPGSEVIPNRGEIEFMVKRSGSGAPRMGRMILQDAKVRKALGAVSGFCDRNNFVIFDNSGSYIVNKDAAGAQKVLKALEGIQDKIEMKRENGVHTLELDVVEGVKPTQGFTRQGRA